MRKKIMTLMMGVLLLLTACGQTGDSSASTMLPVAAVQSAAQAIAPVEGKAQEDVDRLPADEGVEEVKGADDKETPNPADSAKTPSGKMEVTPPPTTPEQAATPAPVPEPVPAPEPKPEPADRWAAVSAANAYAVTQYGVITDGSLTLDNSAYRFPASVAADASQEVLEAKARDMVDYTFRQLMMQAGMDSIADAGFHCNVCIVEDGASLLIYVLYAGREKTIREDLSGNREVLSFVEEEAI